MIPVYKPFLPPQSLSYAHDALDSSWISSIGKYINLAQEKLQDILNVKFVMLTNNGSSATHLVAKSLEFKHKDIKKIIIPNNVYIAAINAFLFENNYQLKAEDCDFKTWNINESCLEQTDFDSTALLIVHNLGNIINVPEIKKAFPKVITVEDNCEGLFGKYNNYYSGTQSLASSISFYGNKNITCGEGGAFITNDQDVFEYAKCLCGQGQSEKRFVHNLLGYNYRLSNVQAAIIYGQLQVLDQILEMKQKVFLKYNEYFRIKMFIFHWNLLELKEQIGCMVFILIIARAFSMQKISLNKMELK